MKRKVKDSSLILLFVLAFLVFVVAAMVAIALTILYLLPIIVEVSGEIEGRWQ